MSRLPRFELSLFLGLTAALALAKSVSSQTQPVDFRASPSAVLEFSLANPGARSLGLGGAFVALADDATAAFANPAGLIQLVRPEISIEMRRWNFSTPFIESGRLSGVPTGISLDQQSGLSEEISNDETQAISFLSYVYPQERWSLAFYYHRQLDFASFVETRGLFGLQAPPPFNPRHPELVSRNNSTIESLGLSVAVELSERWSVGLGIARSEALFTTQSAFFVPASTAPAGIFGALQGTDAERLQTATAIVDAADTVFSVGVFWQAGESWSFGGSIRDGANYAMDLSVRSSPALTSLPSGALLLEDRFDPLEFPAVYGLGAAYRSKSGSLTLSFEWDYVEYSSIIRSVDRQTPMPTGVEIDDANEIHLGAEFALVQGEPLLAFRVGAWFAPDHQIRNTQSGEYLAALFPRGEDIWHGAVGVGIAFDRVQIDVAVDFSERVDTLAVSSIFTF